MGETSENRLRRLRLRSRYRGTREMDLVLGGFADSHLAHLSADLLEAFDMLLSENDQDLYQWVAGRTFAPSCYAAIVEQIRAHLSTD